MRKYLLPVLLYIFLIMPVQAKIINVPADIAKIQSAINASQNGDTILVARGRYIENIDFKGKKIVLTSNYIFDNDTETILNTIIDGSSPSNPDTASCVLLIHGEDSTTVLEGFTITNGKGTAWKDENSAGTYREGGGILIALCSPVIKNNLIINNEAINKTGLASAGGGGIRAGDNNPTIINNVIMRNKGHYGAGIVLNYTGALVKNNFIFQNEGGADYGGGGVWINHIYNRQPVLENNTIVNNYSSSDGGGILIYSGTSVTGRNNIIYGNIASTSSKASISSRGGTLNLTYSLVSGGYPGEGNISSNPLFDSEKFLLSVNSPAIDAGNPAEVYNDPENNSNPGSALYPSMGSLRNDMGAYGGLNRSKIPGWLQMVKLAVLNKSNVYGFIKVNDTSSAKIDLCNFGDLPGIFDSVKIKRNRANFRILGSFPMTLQSAQTDSFKLEWIPVEKGSMTDSLYIYHNDPTLENPQIVRLSGRATAPTSIEAGMQIPGKFSLDQNYPNPFNPETSISFNIPHDGFVEIKVYDIIGNLVQVITKEYLVAGNYTRTFKGNYLSSGIYLCYMKSGSFSSIIKMTLLK